MPTIGMLHFFFFLMDFLYLVYTFTNSPFVSGKEESILTLCWNCLFDLFFVAFVITVIHNGLPQRILPFCLLNFIVQLISCVRLFVIPWTAACQASLSFANSCSLLKLMSIESVMPSNHLVLCHPFLLLPSIFLIIRVFSNELTLCVRWPKYWSFSFSIIPSNE